MRKALLAAGLAALMAMPVMAEDVATLAEKIDRVDEVLYGSVQSGSLIGRADQADNVIYGVGNTSASGLDHRIDNLYADVVRNDNDRTPAISNRMNAMEYYLTDEISTDNLTVRMDNLEKAVLGEAKKGALDERMQSLEQAVYGDQHYEMKTVQLPADTVFKVALNDDVGSKTSQVGDPVSFTVQEDVLVGDVLVLPRGTQGSGVVTEVSRPKSFGRSGKVDVSFDQVFSVDDEAIPTVLGPEAKEKLKMEAAAVGASAIGALALGPIGLVGGLFVKGKDAVLPAGSELYIQTAQPVTTKGLVLREGAPHIVLRKHVARTASAAMATAVEDNQVTVTAAPETAAPAPKAEISDSAKAELEAAREKDSTVKETADSAKTDNEAASVVIMRNE